MLLLVLIIIVCERALTTLAIVLTSRNPLLSIAARTGVTNWEDVRMLVPHKQIWVGSCFALAFFGVSDQPLDLAFFLFKSLRHVPVNLRCLRGTS
eukprot:11146395-Lingulodinium_polyedra.AAC.1